MNMDPFIRVAMFPNPRSDDPWMKEMHPFLLKIANELEKIGCSCLPTPKRMTMFWVLNNRKKIDVIHLHWPEKQYEFDWVNLPIRFPGSNRIKKTLGILWLILMVNLLRIIKIPIVWTIHDIFPHSSQNPSRMQIFARKYLLKNVAVVLLNCKGIESLIQQSLGVPKKVVVSPLGDYKDFYQSTLSRLDARKYLNIKENELMFLFFGTQRPHRNALSLIDAFKELGNNNACLWIAGNTDIKLRQTIEKKCWGAWNIHLYLNLVTNDQLDCLLKATDFVVMPGKNYLTSGVVVLALSYGKPVITPNYGCATNMVQNAGILYDEADDSKSLLNAIKDAIKQKEILTSLAEKQMNSWSWTDTAKKIKQAYLISLEN